MKDSVNVIKNIVKEGLEKKTGHLFVKYHDNEIGSQIIIHDKVVTNFASCSYLGLENHPQLKQGVIEAVKKYGTQFSSSRAYASIDLYEQLEQRLSKLFNATALVTASTTLGHQSCLPTLITKEDLVLIDYQAHASLQQTTKLLKAKQIKTITLQHNDLVGLKQHLDQYHDHYENIWLIVDGVYSMYGDFAPLQAYSELLTQYSTLKLYVDDAHGMTWTGRLGQGYTLSTIQQHPRMIVATSLNKAFACAGGVLLFKNKSLAMQVKSCGETLLFSGPIQPPMLGAAVACSDLHLYGELAPLQQKLKANIELCNQVIEYYKLPLVTHNLSPIFFILCGSPTHTFSLCKALIDHGFYANPGVFPAVPFKHGGVRFTLSANHTQNQIEQFIEVLHKHLNINSRNELSKEVIVLRKHIEHKKQA